MKDQPYEITFSDSQEMVVGEIVWTDTITEVIRAAATYIEANPDLGITGLNIRPEGK